MGFEFTHQSSPLLKNPVMESSSLHKFSFSSLGGVKLRTPLKKKPSSSVQVHAFSYRSFVSSAIEETQRHIQLVPSPLQACDDSELGMKLKWDRARAHIALLVQTAERNIMNSHCSQSLSLSAEQFNCVKSMDGKAELKMLAFQAPKIRLLRSLTIEGSDAMQILDFAVFPEPEYDLPIFCANFFTAASMNIIVLDLNPLHDVIIHKDYKEKYYSNLMPLAVRYAELLPWGGKLTSESMRFFSPIVIWTRFTSSQYEHDTLYSAFMDYYKAWLELMDYAVEEKDVDKINLNREAQHRYLTWRAEKDPGYHVLRRLIGENDAEDVVRSLLFSGVHTLGNKSFLDYFPEYRCEDGTINKKRSMMGKSFETRPWDTGGEFIGNGAR